MAILQFESYRKGLAASTAFNLLSQALGFVSLVLFAGLFGAQEKTDVYMYCAGTAVFVGGFLTSLNASVVIPETMRLRIQVGADQSLRFFNGFYYAYLAVAALVTAVVLAQPVAIVGSLSTFGQDTLSPHRDLLRWAAPMLLGEVAVVGLNDLLVSHRFFTVPMLSAMLNRFVQVTGLLLLHPWLDILAMPVAMLAAYGLQLAALLYMVRRELHWTPAASWRAAHRSVGSNSGLALAGNAASTLAHLAPLYLLSGLGAGVLSAMNYATRVLSMPQNFLTQHVSAVSGVRLNELHARDDGALLNQTFLRSTRGLIFVLTPIAVWLSFQSIPISRLLFERGSFDRGATTQAAEFLHWLGLALPLLGINTLVARLFMAAQRLAPAFWYQTAQNALCIALFVLAVRRFGPQGYALAYLGFHVWNTLALWPLLHRCFPEIQFHRVLLYALGILALNLFLGAAVAFILPHPNHWPTFVTVALTAGLHGLLLLALQARFDLSPELSDMVRGLTTRTPNAPSPNPHGP